MTNKPQTHTESTKQSLDRLMDSYFNLIKKYQQQFMELLWVSQKERISVSMNVNPWEYHLQKDDTIETIRVHIAWITQEEINNHIKRYVIVEQSHPLYPNLLQDVEFDHIMMNHSGFTWLTLRIGKK